MDNFVDYQIKQLLKNDNQYHYEEKDIDMEFVRYCEKYMKCYKKLSTDLYQHLSNLFWKYKEND